MTIEEFRKDFLSEIRANASLNSTTPDDQFINQVVEKLEMMDELYDPQIRYFCRAGKNKRMMQIDGYCIDETDKSIVLIINDYHDEESSDTLTLSKIDTLYKKMINFLIEAYEDTLDKYCDDSDEFIKIGKDFRRRLLAKYATENSDETVEKIKLFILTNSLLSDRVKTLRKDDFLGRKVDLNIWSLERFYEIAISGQEKEPITISMEEFGLEGLECLKADISGTEDYEAYLAIVPGKLLSDIYYRFGSRLLEGNVRAFLSVRGKVNQGIRKTIITEPTKFFTYNNGIATTAKEIILKQKGQSTLITQITDLQIINGGQTTASLTSAFIKKESLLDDIFVPMKLTVVKNNEYESMVQNISRYANSQNKVTDADMFSNHPFHILFEQLSKKYPAPAKGDNVYQTMWYYERSRGKYEQEQFKLKKGSREQEDFKRKYPKNQVIKKEELAKYLNSLDCKPHIVSLGSAKCMNDFAKKIDGLYRADDSHSLINEAFFKRAICSAIIFRETDNLVYKAPWYQIGGYKLNIIPYAISKIMSSIPKGYSLNFGLIWRKQTMYSSLIREVEIVSKIVNDFIVDSHGMIVTEYCKKESTWNEFKNIPYNPSKAFLDDLINEQLIEEEEHSAKKDAKTDANLNILNEIFKLGSPYWRRLLEEGKKRGILSYMDVDLLTMACSFDSSRPRIPSEKQAVLIWQIRSKLDKNGVLV